MAMAMALAKKQKKRILAQTKAQGRLLLFWVLAMYAPWACYMHLRTVYVSKLTKCPLTCPGDLAGDRFMICLIADVNEGAQPRALPKYAPPSSF
jgi:hypothetical protein